MDVAPRADMLSLYLADVVLCFHPGPTAGAFLAPGILALAAPLDRCLWPVAFRMIGDVALFHVGFQIIALWVTLPVICRDSDHQAVKDGDVADICFNFLPVADAHLS